MSSCREDFSLVGVEAMAADRPVIASDLSGVKQVVAGAGIIFGKGRQRISYRVAQYSIEKMD
ncbi:MAG TPA: glycosyltransferase [Candidatus Avamphibacillus sp.]|nr:glycosyltransferase [Candidatus Avamphibacillus sp.]